jgi:hypothetical protein
MCCGVRNYCHIEDVQYDENECREEGEGITNRTG